MGMLAFDDVDEGLGRVVRAVEQLRSWGRVELVVVEPDHRPHRGHAVLVVTACPPTEAVHLVVGADRLAWAWYAVEPHVAHDRRADEVGTEPDVRKVTFHRRCPGLTIDEYRRRYRGHQGIAAEHHVHATRYRQLDVVEQLGPAAVTTDGISELWYPTIDDVLHRHYAGPDSRAAVRADTEAWIDIPDVRAHVGRAVVWEGTCAG